ncbi:hypothetical protein [Streptomyces bauhiniae]
MLCDRCGRPIKGKPEEIPIETGSGAASITVCPVPCKPPRRTRPRSY